MSIETRNINGLHLVLFDPSNLGIYTKPVAGGFAPISPATVLADSGAVAALNGPMFDVCDGQSLPYGNAEYAVSVCDVLEYRHQDGALQARGSYPSRGLTFSVLGDGSVQVLHGDQVASGAKVAIQGYPTIVADGHSVAGSSPNTDIVWRSALVLMTDGRMAFAVMIASMPVFGTALEAAEVRYAIYTDGGGSSAEVTADGIIGSSERRPVPSWIIVRKPSPNGLLWLAGALALGLAWWVWK